MSVAIENKKVRLFEILEEQGRSKTWLAKQLGVNPSTLYKWQDGTHSIKQSAQFKLKELLDLETIDELYEA